MKIQSAEFLLGAAQPARFPRTMLPEVAFVGKSNVGKSSLINTLLRRKSLVKTSATPGKTQQINFFLINGAWRFVDLPGYGFAKVPPRVRQDWERLITTYLRERPCLRGVVLIVDARHDPSPLDVTMKAWLDEAAIPTVLAVNKMDKLNRTGQQRQLALLGRALAPEGEPVACSAQTGLGRDALWSRVRALLDQPAAAEGRSAP